MVPIAVFSGLLALMLVVVVIHQWRVARPAGRHVAQPIRIDRRDRRTFKHVA